VTGQLRLVVNPAAGGGRALRILPPATAALDAAGAAYEVTESASMDNARDIAVASACLGQVVVAVGGDGTAGALAGVVAGAGGSFGIVPAGRGNDLARVLGIPSGPAAAAAVLTRGRLRHIDLIGVSAGDRPERIVAGSVYLGVPALAGEIANAARWLRGPMVYPVAALRALASWQPATFRLECSAWAAAPAAAHEFAGYAVVIANSAYFGAGMQVAPPARIDDGILDIVLMRDGPKLAFVRALVKIRNGSHITLPLISLERGTEISLTVSRDLAAAADGEALPGAAPLSAGAPLRIRVLPSILTVLVPDSGTVP
jgi:diacylglycerol kinase (ATP)